MTYFLRRQAIPNVSEYSAGSAGHTITAFCLSAHDLFGTYDFHSRVCLVLLTTLADGLSCLLVLGPACINNPSKSDIV